MVAAIAVVVGMRTVGLLLVSAIMIVPIAAAQQVTRSFSSTTVIGLLIGVVSTTLGLVAAFFLDVPPGPTIVFLALGAFIVLATGGWLARGRQAG